MPWLWTVTLTPDTLGLPTLFCPSRHLRAYDGDPMTTWGWDSLKLIQANNRKGIYKEYRGKPMDKEPEKGWISKMSKPKHSVDSKKDPQKLSSMDLWPFRCTTAIGSSLYMCLHHSRLVYLFCLPQLHFWKQNIWMAQLNTTASV